jgi:hypothetical protein
MTGRRTAREMAKAEASVGAARSTSPRSPALQTTNTRYTP